MQRFIRWDVRLAICVFLTSGLVACAPVAAQTDTLKLASFNILQGGTGGGQSLTKTRDVIVASGADVVGIQEADGSAANLAQLLGWQYREFSFDRGTELGNSDAAILSRLPITQTLPNGIRVQLAAGKEAFIFNAHLNAYPYQPYDIRDGNLRNESQAVNAAKNARGAQTTEILNQIAPYLASTRATFLTGDFNEPSHLDWTTAAANAGLHPFKVAWPASSAVVAKGFRDSYRQLNSNEVTKPGNTWTPDPGPNEVHDRIDFVYFAGTGLNATAAQIVGENATNADIVVSSYPSDHRSVVSTFTIPSGSLAPVRKGINLISNPGAEASPGAAASADRVLTDWETSQNNTVATAQLYGKAGYAPSFAGSGVNYFYGGITGSTQASQHSISQTIGVSELAAEIDANQIQFDLSGYFGGFDTQNDTASMTCEFLNAGGTVLASVTIGDVTAQNRKNATKLLLRSATGNVPPQTRTARVTLTFKKIADGTFNDGSADNLSLILRNP